MFVLYIALKYL